MTQITSLERAVIRNIAVAMMSTTSDIMVKDLSKGPEAIKPNQVNAVILNLTRKGLVTVFNSESVLLTEAGGDVHSREFPTQKDLDTLRHESNVELAEPQPMSIEELTMTNQIIDIRKATLKVKASLEALSIALLADSLVENALHETALAS